MQTATSTLSHDVHDEAVALVREAVQAYLPIARARRGAMDTDTWSQVVSEVREVVRHSRGLDLRRRLRLKGLCVLV